MYDPTTELMQALARGIELDETLANCLAAAAEQTAGPDRGMWSRALRANGRLHRVIAIKLGARLSAMEEEYGSLHLE